MYDDPRYAIETEAAPENNDDNVVEYSNLDLHPRAKDIQKDFDADHKVTELTVAEKLHFDTIYAEMKFLIFFGHEPTNHRNWYDFLQHNVRVNALYSLQKYNKIKITGFDGTAALSALNNGAKTEVMVPATGAFVITMSDKTEVVIRLEICSDSVEWAVFCADFEKYSEWDKMFRAAIKKYNQYKNSVFDHNGKFIDLPQASFDSIFLDDSIRSAVQTNIIDYIDVKQVLLKKHNGIPTKRGIIFAGEPGTGKTFLSRVLANTLNITFMVVTNLSNLGELKAIFKFASQFERIILLFEDIDIYVKHRDSGSGLLPTMLNELDGIETATNSLIVLCTTNNVDAFDNALKNRPGRFDLILKFNVPNREVKLVMLKGFCKGKDVTNVDFDQLISTVPVEYTGAHLKELYISACILAIEQNSVDANNTVILTATIFEQALNRIERGSATARSIGFNDNKK